MSNLKKFKPFSLCIFFCFVIFLTLNGAKAAEFSLLSSPAEDVTWKDQDNQDIKLSDFLGKEVALTMAYSQCKKTCPFLTIKTLKEIEEYYKAQARPIEFVIVTLDPENDTPVVLKKFKHKMQFDSDNWHFLTGSEDDTRALAKAIDLGAYWKMDDHILHGYKILILDKLGKVEHVFDWNNQDVKEILK